MHPYELGKIIWYLIDNKIHSATLLSRMHIENMRDDWVSNKEQASLFMRWGKTGYYYATVHTELYEDRAFGSKEELILHYSEFNKIFID